MQTQFWGEHNSPLIVCKIWKLRSLYLYVVCLYPLMYALYCICLLFIAIYSATISYSLSHFCTYVYVESHTSSAPTQKHTHLHTFTSIIVHLVNLYFVDYSNTWARLTVLQNYTLVNMLKLNWEKFIYKIRMYVCMYILCLWPITNFF